MQVACRLQLSSQQLLYLRKAMQVFSRMSRATADEGEGVLRSMASLSISRVLESYAHTSKPSSNSNANHPAAAAATAAGTPAAAVSETQQHPEAAAAGKREDAGAAGAAAAVDEAADGIAQIDAVNSKLQRHMRMRNIQACAANCVLFDYMSRAQIAEMCVGELTIAVIVQLLSAPNLCEKCMNTCSTAKQLTDSVCCCISNAQRSISTSRSIVHASVFILHALCAGSVYAFLVFFSCLVVCSTHTATRHTIVIL
jgi:hypothetical protein